MALPWQADFKACGDNWWPVPRPNDVIAQDTGSPARWDRDVGEHGRHGRQVAHARVRRPRRERSTSRSSTATRRRITLLTPHLRFTDVPQGPMGMVREAVLAITFEVISPGIGGHPGVRTRRRAGAPAARRGHTVGHRRSDRRQRRRDRPALGDLPHRRRAVVDPAAGAHGPRGGRHADLDGHRRRQHRRPQDRGHRPGARPLRQHERGPRRRAEQARRRCSRRRTSSST